MQYLDLSYHPQKLFVLADRTLITLDCEFELIVRGKMTQLWTHGQTLRAEGMGYEVGDFRVRIGNVLQAGQVKGVVVEDAVRSFLKLDHLFIREIAAVMNDLHGGRSLADFARTFRQFGDLTAINFHGSGVATDMAAEEC
ncbi:hypothetical protein RUND412_010222 [Rhizina undulata]